MRKFTGAAIAVAATMAWAGSVGAQGRNFAGTWTIDQERTSAAMTASAGGGGAVFGAAGGGRARGGGGGGGGAVASTGTVQATGGGVATGARSGGGGGRGGVGGGIAAGPGPTMIALDANAFSIGTTAYKLDGSVTTIPGPRGDITAKAAWQGDKLVIESTAPTAAGGTSVSKTSWYLEGESLVRETSRTGPDGQPMVSKTYFKRGGF